MTTAWHALSPEEVLTRVASSRNGISGAEAQTRFQANGPNQFDIVAPPSPWRLLASQFTSLLIWVLIFAGGLSLFLGQIGDGLAILAVVVFNAAIGFYQEYRAESALAALKALAAPRGLVRRDGLVTPIPATDIVVGDILVLTAGDLVPADARLLTAASLSCNESALTGESEGAVKQSASMEPPDAPLGDRGNLVFLGTSIATGGAEAVVVATGMTTEFGRIAGMIATADSRDDTPLQRRLDALGRILVWAALGIVVLLFGLGWLRGSPPLELLMTSIGLAVAAVPEGLPAVVTVALSLGVMRMARRRAIVRRLAAVETLGSTSVICTDKTGTLTVGAMTVRAMYAAGRRYDVSGEGYGPSGAVTSDPPQDGLPASLADLATVLLAGNHAQVTEHDGVWTPSGDPTEAALIVAALKAGGHRQQVEQALPIEVDFPFDSDRKLGTIVRRTGDGALRAFTNGAPGPLLERCTRLATNEGDRDITAEDRARILSDTSAMASQALRVLASARRDLPASAPPTTTTTTTTTTASLTANDVEQELTFIGLSGMHDPPRPEVKTAVATCRAAGIRVVMITGDHPETAGAIARDLGIATTRDVVMTGATLDTMDDEALQRRVESTVIYARVTAEHKLRIVSALKAHGEIVAMTGDGVNDAPAIKGSDIGIAMGKSGTDVARQAADMVITDDNFATIVAAVEEGRGIYDNIRKTLQYLLAGNTGELLLMTAAVTIGLPAPLLPIHLIWINLVTDGLPAMCLATDAVDEDAMTRPPRPHDERLANPHFLRTMGLTGLLTAAVAFAVYATALPSAGVAAARSSAFAVLVSAELLRSFGVRSPTRAVWRMSFRNNRPLVAVVVLSLALQVWSQHNVWLGRLLSVTPLSFTDGARLLAIGAIPLASIELVKWWRRRFAPPSPANGLA